MKITPILAKSKLDAAISAISEISWLYAKDPASDFTRDRMLPPETLLRMLLKFSGKSLQSELFAYRSSSGCSSSSRMSKLYMSGSS